MKHLALLLPLLALAASTTTARAEPVAPAATNELRFVILPNGRTTVDGMPFFSREGADHLAAVLFAETNTVSTVIRAEAGDEATYDDFLVVGTILSRIDFQIWKAGNLKGEMHEPRPILFGEIDLVFDIEHAVPVWWPALTIRLGTERVLVGGFRFSRESLGPDLERLPDALRRASNLADGGHHSPVFCECEEGTPLSDLLVARRTAADLGYGQFTHSPVSDYIHWPTSTPPLSHRAWEQGNRDGEWWKVAEDEPWHQVEHNPFKDILWVRIGTEKVLVGGRISPWRDFPDGGEALDRFVANSTNLDAAFFAVGVEPDVPFERVKDVLHALCAACPSNNFCFFNLR